MVRLFTSFLLLVSLKTLGKVDTHSYSLAIGAQLTDGTIKNYSFNVVGSILKKRGSNEWGTNPTYRYLLSYPYLITGTTTPTKQDELYIPSSFERVLKDTLWKILIFSEIEHSRTRKIDYRVNIGGGITYKLIHNKNFRVNLSGAILPDYYKSMSIKNSLPQRDNFSIRTSLRLKMLLKVENITITSIGLFQPAFKTWAYGTSYNNVSWVNNINFRSNTAMDIPIKNGFSFGLSLDYLYQTYLDFLIKQPEVQDSGVFISPYEHSLSFYIKYKKQ